MKEKRDEIIILRLTKTEKNRIYEKMFSMGIRSLSAYIRKMALDGYCLNLDLPQLRRMAYPQVLIKNLVDLIPIWKQRIRWRMTVANLLRRQINWPA